MSLNLSLKSIADTFRPGVRMTLFVLVFLPLTLGLGFWQLDRAEQKAHMQTRYIEQLTMLPITPENRTELEDFLRVRLQGELLAETFLVDNRISQGKAGYWVVQVLEQSNTKRWLINRGFVQAPASRSSLPAISHIGEHVELVGVIWPETGLVPLLAEDPWAESWPKRVQRLYIARMATLTGALPFEVRVEQNEIAPQPAPFVSVLKEEKHLGYAATWFGLALALLVLYIYTGMTGRQDLNEQ